MLVGSQVRRVAVVGGVRIPFARSMGAYAECSNQDMLVATLRALVDRYSLAGERLGDVAAGAVLKHSRDYNLVRESVLSSGLSAETPGMDLQRACGTSLEAAILIGMKIALGQIDSGIAGGVDTASDVPIGVSEGLRRILLRSSRGRTPGRASQAVARTTALAFQAQLACRGRGANRALHGPEHRAHGAHLADHARGSGCIRAGEPSARRRGVRRRLLRRPGGSVPGARGRQQPAPRQHAREARKAPARVSHAWAAAR